MRLASKKRFIKFLSCIFALVLLFSSVGDCSVALAGSGNLVPENNIVPKEEAHNYTDVTIRTPGSVTYNAKKYKGNSTASELPERDRSQYDAKCVIKASYYYNCHSFAWYFGGKTASVTNKKAFWMDAAAVDKVKTHLCYDEREEFSNLTIDQLVQPENRANLKKGDIILYINNKSTGAPTKYSHSAVVYKVDSSGVYVYSKWGTYGTYCHKADKCPYARLQDDAEAVRPNAVYAKVIVYRPGHSNVDNSIVPTASSSTKYVFPSYVQKDASCHKDVCDCGRGYKKENHDFKYTSQCKYKCVDCGYIKQAEHKFEQVLRTKYKCKICGYIYDSSISINSCVDEGE